MVSNDEILKIIKNNSLLNKLERISSTVHNPGLSISNLILIKTRILFEWVIRNIFSIFEVKRAKNHNRKFTKIAFSETALVLGNGPSIMNLNHLSVKEAQAQGKLDVFTVNRFLQSKIYSEGLTPDFLTLTDPMNHPDSEFEPEVWEELMKNFHVKLIAPMHWYSAIMQKFPEILPRTIFIKDSSLEGFTKNINPNRSRGYFQFTLFKALAFAVSKNYKKIYVLGMDNSFFQTLEIDQHNKIIQKSNHAIGTEQLDQDMTQFFIGGVADYFYFISILFKNLREVFSNYPIENLDLSSYVDAFTKSEGEDGLYLLRSPIN